MASGRMRALVAAIWTLVVGLLDVIVGTSIVRQIDSERFIPTMGTVTRAEVLRRSDEDGVMYNLDIRYRYAVGGRAFEGETYRYSLSSFWSSDSAWAEQAVRLHPAGTAVTVYHDENDPAQSLLKPGFAGTELFMIMFMTPFNAAMAACWVMAGASFLRTRRGLPPTPRLHREGALTRVRLPQIPTGTAGFVGVGCAAFAGVFAVLLSEGVEASIGFMLLAWAVVLIAGIAFGLWQWWGKRRGAFDLVVGERTVTLPERIGRFRRATIERTSIRAVTVKTWRFIPFLGSRIRIECRDGRSKTIAVWHDDTVAKQFAAQLNDAIVVAR